MLAVCLIQQIKTECRERMGDNRRMLLHLMREKDVIDESFTSAINHYRGDRREIDRLRSWERRERRRERGRERDKG